MKKVLLIEVDIPDDIHVHEKQWIRDKLGPTTSVRVLRYKDFEEYEAEMDDYWRFG